MTNKGSNLQEIGVGSKKFYRAERMSVLEFLMVCQKLKTTKRTGWVKRGIQNAESIGDHMHRMSIIALLISDETVDKDKLVKMAVVHDLAEAVVGDITPHCNIPKDEKAKMERDAMESFIELLGGSKEMLEIKQLWEEYEAGTTKEALLCKDIDKVYFARLPLGPSLNAY